VEDRGADLQIVVDNALRDDAFHAHERARRLAMAPTEALLAIEREGVARPDVGLRPRLASGPLPPRG